MITSQRNELMSHSIVGSLIFIQTRTLLIKALCVINKKINIITSNIKRDVIFTAIKRDSKNFFLVFFINDLLKVRIIPIMALDKEKTASTKPNDNKPLRGV